MVVGGLLLKGGRPFKRVADWLHCTADMYLTNVQRLALHLEGNPDAPQTVVAAAVAKTGYKGYVAPDYVAAVPAAAGKPSPPAPAPGVPAPTK